LIPDELEIVKLTFESLELFGLVVVGSSVTSMQEKPTSTWQKSLGFCGRMDVSRFEYPPRCVDHCNRKFGILTCKIPLEQSSINNNQSKHVGMVMHVDDNAKPSAHFKQFSVKTSLVARVMVDVESQCGSIMR